MLTRRHFLTVAGAGAVASAGYVALSNRLEVTRHARPRRGGASPLRVAHLSDLHAPHDWIEPEALARAVRAFAPDLVVVTGDAVQRRGTEALVREYAALTARLGAFAVIGNWERWGRCDEALLRREYERAGIRLLVNETAAVDCDGEPVSIVGLDDFRSGAPDYPLLRASSRAAGRRLVLSHCPITFDVIAAAAGAAPVDVLAGHTHGGQIAPFGLALHTPPGSGRYVKGWYGLGVHRMYVSRGLGNSGPPFRLGARPELALLEL